MKALDGNGGPHQKGRRETIMSDLKGLSGEGNRVGRTGARWPVVASAIAVALIAGLLASPAAAYHIPGADYSGAVSGGGSISFSVSGDGSSVTNLALTGPIERSGCTLNSTNYTQPTPITNNAFDNGEVSGNFPNVRGAYGHLNVLVSSFPSSCRVTGTWSAITSASPAGSEECKAAQAQVKKTKRPLRKAEKTASQPKFKKLRSKWEKARSIKDQVC